MQNTEYLRTLKLLQREQNHSNVEDARFFGEAVHHLVIGLSMNCSNVTTICPFKQDVLSRLGHQKR